ncbi:MAG TPA: cytochrome c [Phycisphaerales bacterium]|nr:cytochrome c [Phycisphaerales bacterium]
MGPRLTTAILCIAAATALSACAGSTTDPAVQQRRAALAPVPLPQASEQKGRDYAGIHNAVAFHPGFVSGSQPEGDEGFQSLAAMGVRTIISVDGAEPEVEKARAYGLRYIHLPIGYNGFDEERRLQLARAAQDSIKDGPVYIHCHHGKHRSAGAAAAIASTLGWQTPEHGVARMKVSGTAPNYTGLYACAVDAAPVAPAALDAVVADFPSRWKPSGYVSGMVEIDEVFEHLKEIQAAGWAAPNHHPDLVPAAEAGRLADLYRLLHTDDVVKRKGAGMAELMQDSNRRAQILEDLLAAGEKDKARLNDQFKLVSASCKDCHSRYRD